MKKDFRWWYLLCLCLVDNYFLIVICLSVSKIVFLGN